MSKQMTFRQKRVLSEKNELNYNLMRLVEFMHTVDFERLDEVERNLMADQVTAMTKYRTVLESRIMNFGIQLVRL